MGLQLSGCQVSSTGPHLGCCTGALVHKLLDVVLYDALKGIVSRQPASAFTKGQALPTRSTTDLKAASWYMATRDRLIQPCRSPVKVPDPNSTQASILVSGPMTRVFNVLSIDFHDSEVFHLFWMSVHLASTSDCVRPSGASCC